VGLDIVYSSDSQPGVRVPPWVRDQATVVTQNLKSPQNKPIPVFYLYKIGHQWWYGGMQSVKTLFRQRGKIMIWGYASTKRLRTPGLGYLVNANDSANTVVPGKVVIS
jgi:hypothetical protein